MMRLQTPDAEHYKHSNLVSFDGIKNEGLLFDRLKGDYRIAYGIGGYIDYHTLHTPPSHSIYLNTRWCFV